MASVKRMDRIAYGPYGWCHNLRKVAIYEVYWTSLVGNTSTFNLPLETVVVKNVKRLYTLSPSPMLRDVVRK